MKRLFSGLLFFVLLLGMSVRAQGTLIAPPQIDGEAVYIPFPVSITLDGDLSDWANVPRETVTKGPMVSGDPANNGSFSFAVAADAHNFYILMTSVDANIVTGQHGMDYWNEDSLEFYLNLSGDLAATAYDDGIYQINVNPGDIGKTDVNALTITGVDGTDAHVTGIVFKTPDGWGFEAAVPLPFSPTHGQEIGFQAQANGAAKGADRDVKLIWSNADTNDNSWQNPSLFGRGIFFEVGRSDIPTLASLPTATPTAVPSPTPTPVPVAFVSVNQTGYFPDGEKIAVYPTLQIAAQPFNWSLIDTSSGQTVASGQTLPGVTDAASGDVVNVIDFSSFSTPGTYRLKVGEASSAPFEIGSDIYGKLAKDALHYFYLSRSGIALETQYAGQWARPAGHLSDSSVTCFKGQDASGTQWPGCDYSIDASGGWYDAGDYGKYVVNGGISEWTLVNMVEFDPSAFADGDANIPENANGVPDVLDEARWEMNFLLEMQVPQGQPQAGMAFHKLHTLQWDGLPLKPVTQTTSADERFLMPPSTAATLNLAATAAQCARVWKTFDPAFSDRCLTAAERAWQAANDNPIFTYGSIPGQGGGDYSDSNVSDEFFWAAAELYVTTGDPQYHDFLVKSPYFAGQFNAGQETAIYWGDTGVLGTLTLALHPSGLSADEQQTVQALITKIADNYAQVTQAQGYRVAMPTDGYSWGSNSNLLNNALVMAYAYRFSHNPRYLDAVAENMDYVLGRNSLNFSFVSGYGTDSMQHPQHRFWADEPSLGFPPVPPGVLAGGPNAQPSDPVAEQPTIADRSPAKRYVDDIGSYSTNEVAINWNAPLAWVTAFLNEQYQSH